MPTIYRPKKKSSVKREKARLIYDCVYNTGTWKRLRAAYLQAHPLCQDCLEQRGEVTPATQVHHMREISQADNWEDMQEIGFDWFNLRSLCDQCHIKRHHHLKKAKEDTIY